jgi:hypothetical protein
MLVARGGNINHHVQGSHQNKRKRERTGKRDTVKEAYIMYLVEN